MNVINSEEHSGNDLFFQEFMLIPLGLKTFRATLRCDAEIMTYGRDMRLKFASQKGHRVIPT